MVDPTHMLFTVPMAHPIVPERLVRRDVSAVEDIAARRKAVPDHTMLAMTAVATQLQPSEHERTS